MKFLVDSDNRIVYIGNDIHNLGGGNFQIGNSICGASLNLVLHDVDVPENVQKFAYLYENSSFVKNSNYMEYKTPEQKIVELEQAIAELSIVVAGGGV